MFRLLAIIVLFGAALASGAWGLHNREESQTPKEETVYEYNLTSVSEILAGPPEDITEIELKDFYFAKEAIGVDLDGEPGWEEAYIPLFPNDVALQPHNLLSVIYKTDQLKNSDDTAAFFENETLKGFYIAGNQKLSKVAFGKLAKRYGSLDYDASVLITSELPKEPEIIESYWFAFAGFAGFLLLAGWQSMGLIGDLRNRNSQDKPEADNGTKSVFSATPNSNEPPKYKPQ